MITPLRLNNWDSPSAQKAVLAWLKATVSNVLITKPSMQTYTTKAIMIITVVSNYSLDFQHLARVPGCYGNSQKKKRKGEIKSCFFVLGFNVDIFMSVHVSTPNND